MILLGAIGGLVYSFFAKPVFESRTRFSFRLVTPVDEDPKIQQIADAARATIRQALQCRQLIEECAQHESWHSLEAFEETSWSEMIAEVQRGLVVAELEPGTFYMSLRLANDSELCRQSLQHLIDYFQLVWAEWSESARASVSNQEWRDVSDLKLLPFEFEMDVHEAIASGTRVNGRWRTVGVGGTAGAVTWLVIWVLIQFLGWYSLIPVGFSILGVAFGVAFFWFSPPIYESVGQFVVHSNFLPSENTPELILNDMFADHQVEYDEMFGDLELIDQCLDSGALRMLHFLEGIPTSDHAQFAALSLRTRRLDECPRIIELRMRANSALDSRTFLNALIAFQYDLIQQKNQKRAALRFDDYRSQAKELAPDDIDARKELFERFHEIGVIDQRGTSISEGFHDMQLLRIANPDMGRLVSPLLYANLLYGALGGYLFGLFVGSVLHSISKSKRESDTVAKSQ